MERKVPILATRWQQTTVPDSCVAPRRGMRDGVQGCFAVPRGGQGNSQASPEHQCRARGGCEHLDVVTAWKALNWHKVTAGPNVHAWKDGVERSVPGAALS